MVSAAGLATDASGNVVVAAAASAYDVGEVAMFGAAAPSSKWIACDGGQYAVATYPALDAYLTTTWGPRTNGAGAAGTTHFRSPDMRGRSPVGTGTGTGANASGTGLVTGGSALTARATAAWTGNETHTLAALESGVNQNGSTTTSGNTTTNTESVDHTHSGTTSGDSPNHSHYMDYAGAGASTVYGLPLITNGAGSFPASNIMGGTSVAHTHTVTTGGRSAAHTHTAPAHSHPLVSRAADNTHNNTQPIICIPFFIRAIA